MTHNSLYLVQYREAIRRGEIIAGKELIIKLDRLIADLDNPRYFYDTQTAYDRIAFIETCAPQLLKKTITLALWQKALIEVAYSFKMADSCRNRFTFKKGVPLWQCLNELGEQIGEG